MKRVNDMKYENISELTGKTPVVKISKFGEAIYGKLESFNPMSSVKDRIAASMIEDAEKNKKISPGDLLIEPTSGNTGIGLAFIAAAKGYRLILTMPDTMSIERRKLLKFLGAQVVLTDGKKGMKGAIEEAEKIAEQEQGHMLQQFNNSANWKAHYKGTGPEIWKDLEENVDIFVAGVGTGGTITGVGKYLKEKNPKIKIVAVEPADSPVLSGGKPGPHKIQGIGAGFVPEILDRDLIDGIITVDAADALDMSKRLAKREGIFCGISSGANVWAALKEAEANKGKNIVTIICDTGERYLSTALFEGIEA